MNPAEAERLGRRLYTWRFQPLPDVNDDGQLIGTILWRVAGGHVEYLALGTNGLALATRARARFSYRSPHLHGPVIDHRFGEAWSVLDWLLSSAANGGQLPRPPGQHRGPDQ